MMTTIRKSKGNGPKWGLLVALAIILVTNWAQPQAADPPKPDEQSSQGSSPAWGGSDPQYLIFWGDAKRVLDVRARIGTAGDGKSRLLGFGSVNLPFDTS